MLQYIINSSAIWLLGLVVFDLLLRKETSHAHNRFYLLGTLFAGALIPLWSWGYDGVIYGSAISEPIVEQSAVIKADIVSASEQNIIGWEQWLFGIYIAGAAIILLFLFREVVLILGMYRSGRRYKDGTWTIIETDKPISPFSAFRYVFISNRENYTTDELSMILAHEEQHGHLLHFVDVLLIKIATVVFWFNPLPYLLERRLLLVHEYQADKAVGSEAAVYSKFLVEQSVLGLAPVLAHSFIRSPLKKRILMLTQTTKKARGKQLLIAPILLISMLCFTNNAFPWQAEPKRDGNKVTYNGNVIEYSEPSKSDTVDVVNSETGEPGKVITRREAMPIMLNGEKVYHDGELKYAHNVGRYRKKSAFTDQAIKEYLLHNMQKEIRKLDDGDYRLLIEDVVIDKHGDIVYFKFGGMFKVLKSDGVRSEIAAVPDKIEKVFARKTASLLNNAPSHEPAIYDSKEVHSVLSSTWAFRQPFTVKDKKLTAL